MRHQALQQTCHTTKRLIVVHRCARALRQRGGVEADAGPASRLSVVICLAAGPAAELWRSVDISPVEGGAKLCFTQIGVPPNRYSGHYRGWIEAYWTPMKEIFANGVISDATRAKVKVHKTLRIQTQHFRRRLSKEAR